MAQYWEDWSGQTVGNAPTGWTARNVTTGVTCVVQDDAAAPAGKSVRISKTASGRYWLTWDAIDADPDRATVNISMLVRAPADPSDSLAYTNLGALVRASGAAGAEYGYYTNLREETTGRKFLAWNKYNNGAAVSIGPTVPAADKWAFGTLYWIHFSAYGTNIRAKLSTPAAPTTYIQDSSVIVDSTTQAAGYIGIFAFAALGADILAVGVGTNGDLAPLTPLTDTTAPILSSPSGGATGSSSASGTVSTTEGNGTLYYLVSTNSTETAATIKAGSSKAVTTSGEQSVTVSGLSPSTSYYIHYVQEDASNNQSNVASSSVFTTSAATGGLAYVFSGDSFNIHPTNSSISNETTDNPTVIIAPRKQRIIDTDGDHTRWRNFYGKITNANGKRPLFKLLYADYFESITSSWKPWYSYDNVTWYRFPTPTVNGSYYDFQLATAFTGNDVWIGFQPGYPVSRTQSFISELVSSYPSVVRQLPSANSSHVIDTLASQTDELGNIVPTQSFHGFGIWENGAPDRAFVLTCGVHPGEHTGDWMLEGFLRFLVSSDAKAVYLRQNFKFLVYPNVNPIGRYGGHIRGQWATIAPYKNANRDFGTDVDAFQLENSQVLRDALVLDLTNKKLVGSLDFHGQQWNPSGKPASTWFYPDTADTTLVASWEDRMQVYAATYLGNLSTAGPSAITSFIQRVYGTKHSYTPESYEQHPATTGVDAWRDAGSHFAKALADSPLSEMPIPAPIVLSASYERSSVNLLGSSVAGSGSDATITIRPRVQESEAYSSQSRWLEPSARIDNVLGHRPTFKFTDYAATAAAGKYHGAPWESTRRPVFSYDREAWHYFDTCTVGTSDITFRHNTAFTSPTVYIGRSRQISVAQKGAWLEGLATAYPTLFHPAPSADAFTPTLTSWPAQAFIADEFSAQTNELGQAIPATPFYAAVIDDGAPGKIAAYISMGVHAGEDHSDYVCMSAVERLLGSSDDAVALRSKYRIYVYPCVNAPGRAGGGMRGSFTQGTAGADDLNRHFSETTSGLEIVNKPKAAMVTDRGDDVLAFGLDFHGAYSTSWGVYATNDTFATGYQSRINAKMSLVVTNMGENTADSLGAWYLSETGGTGTTLEFGDKSPVPDSDIDTYTAAMLDVLVGMSADGTIPVYNHALTASNLTTSSPMLGTPSLAQVSEGVDALTATSLVTASPSLGSPSLSQIHTLVALGLTVASPVLGTPALTSGAVAPITAAEVARTVRATARMRTVRYEIARA